MASKQSLRHVEISPLGNFAISFSICCIFFLTQLAVNIGEFAASADFACYLLFAGALALSAFCSTEWPLPVLWIFIGLWGACGILISSGPASPSSLALLVVLYGPYCLRFSNKYQLGPVQAWVERRIVLAIVILSVVAVFQLMLVNLVRIDALKNISFLLPDQIRAAGIYTFTREEGGIIKANGFFLRESSSLSSVTALGFLLEYFAERRLIVLVLLSLGLVASISGTGVLIILVGVLFPTSIRQLPKFVLGLSVLSGILALSGDLSWLELWLGRLNEFQTPGTSGYARFVAPIEMVSRSLESGVFSALFGNGGGSYLRAVSSLYLKYEISDPTWAKLLYEYGVIGFLAIFSLFLLRLRTARLPTEVCIAIVYSWLSAGSVLKPDFVFLIWLLTLTPCVNRAGSRAAL